MKELIDRLKTSYTVEDYIQQRSDLAHITVSKETAVDFISHLQRVEGYKHLVILTAVDWIEDGKFQLTYLLNNPEMKNDINVKVFIERENATMESIHHLWEQARTYQRELKEMFGIDFPGSPGVDKPFILEGWHDLPPYRRDFDTKKYSEETYFPRPGREKNDPATYMKQKLYPNE